MGGILPGKHRSINGFQVTRFPTLALITAAILASCAHAPRGGALLFTGSPSGLARLESVARECGVRDLSSLTDRSGAKFLRLGATRMPPEQGDPTDCTMRWLMEHLGEEVSFARNISDD